MSEQGCTVSACLSCSYSFLLLVFMFMAEIHLCYMLWLFLCITDQLLSLCLLSFECLNIASSKYLCLTTIEETFFMPLWNALMALFRLYYYIYLIPNSVKFLTDTSCRHIMCKLQNNLFPFPCQEWKYQDLYFETKIIKIMICNSSANLLKVTLVCM